VGGGLFTIDIAGEEAEAASAEKGDIFAHFYRADCNGARATGVSWLATLFEFIYKKCARALRRLMKNSSGEGRLHKLRLVEGWSYDTQ
jgi:hypothetical protein